MRDLAAAHFANAAAPQAPARNRPPSPPALHTYNSHRRVRPRLGERRVYRPARRRTLSRIDETPPPTLRARSESLQRSADFSSTRPALRSRSNISADTGRSVPVCNQSHETGNQLEGGSPQYAEPRSDSSSCDRPESMSDLPVVVPVHPAAGAYVPYPECASYRDDGCRFNRFELKKRMRKFSSKHSSLYLAFMY